MKSQRSGKLPLQTMMNPWENISGMTLRDDKHLDEATDKAVHPFINTTYKVEPSIPKSSSKLTFNELVASHSPPLFPIRLAKSNKKDQKKVLETFWKVHVHIPLLDAIKNCLGT